MCSSRNERKKHEYMYKEWSLSDSRKHRHVNVMFPVQKDLTVAIPLYDENPYNYVLYLFIYLLEIS